jgi:cobalt/nickel transport system permease protein
MHLPDGFLSGPVSGAMVVASAGAVAAAVRQVTHDEREGQRSVAPLMGVTAAFVFTAQMFNFPIAAGTSGHLLGAALATALLGPWRAILVMTAVVLIQAFGFADGGVAVLGANVFNMGVAGCLLSGLVLPVLGRVAGGSRLGRSVALGVAAWLSVLLAAGLTGLQIAVSGRVAAGVVLPAMLGVHTVIGLGEALLSVAAYNLLVGARPELAGSPDDAWAFRPGRGAEPWRVAAVLGLGLLVVRLAVPHPDGLEHVAERTGFASAAQPGFERAPLPDYAVPGREPRGFDWAGSYVSALRGMGACALLMGAIGSGCRRRRGA